MIRKLLVVPLMFGAFLVAAAVLAVAAVVGGVVEPSEAATSCSVTVAQPQGPNNTGLTKTQFKNAVSIIGVGEKLHVDTKGLVISIAVALTESSLLNQASAAVPASLNFPHDAVAAGDYDSVGLMQQRASWGSVKQRMTPTVTARLFFQGGSSAPDGYHEPGLADIGDYTYMTVAQAAQAVQVSAYPSAYEAWVSTAVATVEKVGHVDASGSCNGGGPTSGPWVNPLDPENDGDPDYYYSATFGECGSHWENCHTGLDMVVPSGTAVYADHDGTVIFAGWGGGYGNLLEIDNGNGIVTFYAHNSVLFAQEGDKVKTGQRVSLSGETGNTTGPHLHYEIRINGTPVDPYTFMAQHHIPHHQM